MNSCAPFKRTASGRPNSSRAASRARRIKARDLMRMIAESTYFCGDPGMQYDTTINDWHTCSNTARINASNPCSEYMHLDNSACNLASLNLLKYLREDGVFDTESFRRAVDIVILAQDILIDNSSYPTPEITANAHAFRELGMGYANLGALLDVARVCLTIPMPAAPMPAP